MNQRTVRRAALAVALGVLVAGRISVEGNDARQLVTPLVFQASGPNAASIQCTVDQYRDALGAVNNGNNAGPLESGRREINWDGGGSTATSPGPTPFTVFLNTRGANIITPGSGFVQAPLDGLVATFVNPTYATIYQAFSPSRFFSPVGSNVTEVGFSIPGSVGTTAATTTGFGAVFSDVDRPDGRGLFGRRNATALIEYFDKAGEPIFSSFVPASPGDASLSFFGILFDDARIARVRIKTGNVIPGADDTRRTDVVMMDDFLYGEPKAIQ